MRMKDEARELYYREIEYEERLNSKSNIFLALLTLLGSGNALVFERLLPIHNIQWDYYSMAYTLCCTISAIMFLNCVAKFYFAHTKYTYARMPIKQICDITGKLSRICNEQDKMDELLEKAFFKAAIINREENLRKNYWQRSLTASLFIASMITIATYIVSEEFEDLIVHIF